MNTIQKLLRLAILTHGGFGVEEKEINGVGFYFGNSRFYVFVNQDGATVFRDDIYSASDHTAMSVTSESRKLEKWFNEGMNGG